MILAKIRKALSSTERGSTSLEFVLWAPVLLVFIGLLLGAGRLALTGNAVQSAAFAAAREASLARTSATAQAAGENGANFSLNSNGISCTSRTVSLDLSDFNKPLGTTGTVTATLSCSVPLAALAVPGLPGSWTIERTAQSPVDPYRERG